jgi:hypothetical protein
MSTQTYTDDGLPIFINAETNVTEDGLPIFEVKKKEPTEEELESFKTSVRGVSEMPKEYASEVPSTQTKEKESKVTESDKITQDLEKELKNIYVGQTKLTPTEKLSQYKERTNNIQSYFEPFLSKEIDNQIAITKNYENQIASLLMSVGGKIEGDKIIVPEEKFDEYNSKSKELYTNYQVSFNSIQSNIDVISNKYKENIDKITNSLGLVTDNDMVSISDEDKKYFDEAFGEAQDIVINKYQKQLEQQELDKYKNQGFFSEMKRLWTSGSWNTLSSIAGAKVFIDDASFEFIQKPILKAKGATEEEIKKVELMVKNIPSSSLITTEMAKALRDRLQSKSDEVKATARKYEEGIFDSIVEGKYGDAFRQIIGGVVESSPQMVVLAATSGQSVAASFFSMFITSASDRYGDLENNEKLDVREKIGNAALYGTFEAAGEMWTRYLFKGIGESLKGLGKEELVKASKSIADNFFVSVIGEGGSEASTELGQQLADYYMGLQDSIDWKRVFDATAVGVGMGIGIGGIAKAAKGLVTSANEKILGRRIASPEQVTKVNEITSNIAELQKQKDVATNKSSEKVIDKEIEVLEEQRQNIANKNIEDASFLNAKEFKTVEELNQAVEEFDKEIEKVKEEKGDVTTLETLKGKVLEERKNVIDGAKERAKTQEKAVLSEDNVDYSDVPEIERDLERYKNLSEEEANAPKRSFMDKLLMGGSMDYYTRKYNLLKEDPLKFYEKERASEKAEYSNREEGYADAMKIIDKRYDSIINRIKEAQNKHNIAKIEEASKIEDTSIAKSSAETIKTEEPTKPIVKEEQALKPSEIKQEIDYKPLVEEVDKVKEGLVPTATPKVFNEVVSIANQVAQETGLKGDELISEVGKRVDEVTAGKITADDIIEIKDEILPQIKDVVTDAQEVLAVEKPIKQTETVVAEEKTVKEEKIVIPKEKKAVSERFAQRQKFRGIDTPAYKLVEENATKGKYSQDESLQKASNIVKQNINEDGTIDTTTLRDDLLKENADVINFALSETAKIYDALANDETLSKEERDSYSEKLGEVVVEMAERGLQGGRGSASFAKIYKTNPVFDARVRMTEALLKDKSKILSEEYKQGQTKGEFIEQIRQEVLQVVQDEITKLRTENKALRDAIEKNKQPQRKLTKDDYKRIADKVRKIKAPKDVLFAVPVPTQLWDAAVEIVAKAIETAGDIAIAINQALDYIKKNDWYKNLTDEGKTRFDKYFADEVTKEYAPTKSVEDVITDHYSDATDKRALSKKLQEDAGLNKSEADRINKLVKSVLPKSIKDKIKEVNKKNDNVLPKKEFDKLLETIREGALDNETFTALFQEKFGFNNITREGADFIKNYVKQFDQLMKEGKNFLASQVLIDMSNQLAKFKPKEVKDIYNTIHEFQHAFILSGINTFYNAGIGGGLALSIEAIPELISKGFLPALYGVGVGVYTSNKHFKEALAIANTHRGFYDKYGRMDESLSNEKEGYLENILTRPFLGYTKQAIEKLGNDEQLTKDFLNEWLKTTLVKSLVVTSLLKSQDAFFRGSATDVLVAAEEFNKAAEELGHKGILGKVSRLMDLTKIIQKANEKLGIDNATKVSIQNQVAKEIKDMKASKQTIPPNYKSRREYELRLEKGDREAYDRKIKAVTDWILLNPSPDGVAGWLYRGIDEKLFKYTGKNKASRVGTAALRVLILFPRLAANSANAVFRNIPVIGMFNAVAGLDYNEVDGTKFKWVKEDTKKMTQRIMTNAAITTATLLLGMDMFDWDDDEKKFVLDPDRTWDFTSYGTGSFKENMRYGIDTKFAWRRRKGDGEWGQWHGTYLAPHLMPMVGFLGRWADDLKGIQSESRKKKLAKKTKAGNRYGEVIRRTPEFFDYSLRALGEQQYNSVSRAIKKVEYADDKGAGYLWGLGSVAMGLASNFTQPAIMRDIIQESYRWNDENKKDARKNFSDQLFKGYYIAESFMNHDMTDFYGNPVPRDSRLWSFTSQYINKYKDLPEYKMLWKFDTLKMPNTSWLPYDETLEPDDKADAREWAKKSFGKYVKDNVEQFDKYTQPELEKALDIVWEYSKKDGLYATKYSIAYPEKPMEEIEKQFEDYRSAGSKMMKVLNKELNLFDEIEEIMNRMDEQMLRTDVEMSIGKFKK